MPSFDGPNLLITLDAPVNGVATVDVEQNLYTAWKTWFKTGNNSRFPLAFRGSVAGDPLSLSLDIGAYFFLQNNLGWRIKPFEADATYTFTGNLIAEDTTLPILKKTVGNFNVLINGLQPITQNVDAIVNEQLRLVTGLKYLVETGNRQSHGGFGNIFFWDPVNGLDTRDGTTPAKAVRTFTKALALTTASNHDTIFAIPGAVGTTIYTTPIEINKKHTFLRGPGPNFCFQSSSATSPGILLSAEGTSIEGFAVNQLGVGQPAVKVVERNLLLKDLSIRNSPSDGLEIDETGASTTVPSTNIYDNLDIIGSGGHNIHIRNKARHSFFQGKIHLMAAAGDGCRMSGDVISMHFIHPIFHKNNGYAMNILDSAVTDTLLDTPSYGRNVLGKLKDSGTRTVEVGKLLKSLPIFTVVSDVGNTSRTFKTDLTDVEVNKWADVLIRFISGNLEHQVKQTDAFAPATDFITVDPLGKAFTAIPDVGSIGELVNR